MNLIPNRRFGQSAALALYFGGILTACGPERVRIALPPPELLQCADEPTAPDLAPRDGSAATQLARDVAMLNGYLALRTAFGSCKAAVEGVNAWSRQMKDH